MSPVGVSFFFFYFFFTGGRSLEITMSIGSVSRVLQLIGSLSDKWSWSQASVLAGVHPAAMSLNKDAEYWVCHVITVTEERWEGMQQSFATVYKDLRINQSINQSINQILIYLSGLQGATIVVAHATKNCHLQLNIFIGRTWNLATNNKQLMLSQFRICDFIPACNLSHNVLRHFIKSNLIWFDLIWRHFIKMYFWVHLNEILDAPK